MNFLKAFTLVGTITLALSCSDESASTSNSPDVLNYNDSTQSILDTDVDTIRPPQNVTDIPQNTSSSEKIAPDSASISSSEVPAQSVSSSSEVPAQSVSSSSEEPTQSVSSSSEVPAQSVSSSSEAVNAISPSYTIKQGGASGDGWGSRYWDCCMPHCAWSYNTSNPTKVCNAQMQFADESIGSVCDDKKAGYGGVCDTQAPWAVNDQFAFAFAAVPVKYGGTCGKCYLLTFDGGRHNGDPDEGTKSLTGKKMIIMVSNIGGDVDDGQFDIMIPGGGVGLFNGCASMLGVSSTGKQYGGFISDCKHDPACIIEKCEVFSKYPKIQAGCVFSATWMNGASNPTFKFEELESCPSEIASRW